MDFERCQSLESINWNRGGHKAKMYYNIAWWASRTVVLGIKVQPAIDAIQRRDKMHPWRERIQPSVLLLSFD